MSPHVLLIDDDIPFSNLVKRALIKEGYSVEIAEDGISGLQMFAANPPDLVLLDWILPGLDGLEVCRRIRENGPQPILMLTGKERTQDRVAGLDAGADDYMVKPYDTDELMARIRALLRRTQIDQAVILTYGDLALDTSSRQATRNGRLIYLTAKEYDLLELFIRNPHKVLTRELIFDRVWGYDFGGESNVLDVYIRYLRQKLESHGEPRLLYTARGVGYVLRAEP